MPYVCRRADSRWRIDVIKIRLPRLLIEPHQHFEGKQSGLPRPRLYWQPGGVGAASA
jgi:hypothetical protein